MASFQTFKDQILISVIAGGFTLLYTSMSEMRSDIKTLLVQTANNSARIDNLEKVNLKNAVTYGEPFPPSEHNRKPLRYEMVAVLRDENLTPKNNETFNRRTKRKLLEHI